MIATTPRSGPLSAPLEACPAADLSDLREARAFVYWSDLVGSGLAGWALFALACRHESWGATLAASLGATLLLYRAHLFIHELSHAALQLPRFAFAWNLLAGFPLLVPSSFAVGVHQLHHGRKTYGTTSDPEYLPFATSRWLILRFVLLCIAFPWLMCLRFLVIGPVALCIPPLQMHLEKTASSLAMNPAFVRRIERRTHRTLQVQQAGLMLFWAAIVSFAWSEQLPLRVLWVWLAVATGVSLANGIRTLASHRYLGGDTAFDRDGQKDDSIDTPGAWWTELWAPVGHRYHALHHQLPALPYHNLGKAYRRLHPSSPRGSQAPGSTSPGLLASLEQLWVTAGSTRRRP